MTAPPRSYPKAVIFDVYQTILRVGPAPDDASERWRKLWAAAGADEACPTLDAFSIRCRRIVDAEHAWAKACGIEWPEVVWPEVLVRALPALAALENDARDQWVLDHQSCLRTLSPMPEMPNLLIELHRSDVVLGIASNAQAYTLRESDAVFDGLFHWREVFDLELCVWSYACGFSKPAPHIFMMLTARLLQRGIAPHEILMVGDRMDNDIMPARQFGWQTWHLCDQADPDYGGSGAALKLWLNPHQ